MPSVRIKAVLALALALAVLIVFWRVGGYGFIDYDDGTYVFNNPYVLKGWSLDGLQWAFTTNLHAHWHPLTWLSLMTDSQLFGVRPGAFHLVSLGIHVLNTLLLFYVLARMTGAAWRSAFAAALFGLHPLHVEPVAWIADRKDVLSALFWMTTLWLYFRYAWKPGVGKAVAVLASFMCALLTKSMSVTLPFILLVLDYWPLRRFAFQGQDSEPERPSVSAKRKLNPAGKDWTKTGDKIRARGLNPANGDAWTAQSSVRLLLEKVPLLILAVVVAMLAAVIYQEKQTALFEISQALPSLHTLARAVFAYSHYLYRMVWPAGLAIPYPLEDVFPWWETGLSLCLLAAISLLAYKRRRRNPYLLAGWLWYLVTLLPASGILPGGTDIQADRYTYLPLVGVFIMIAWGAPDLMAKVPRRQWILGAGAAASISGCMAVSYAQAGYWENTVTLFSHSLAVTRNNDVALNNLGLKLLGSGKTDEAMSYFLEAAKISPNDAFIHVNLGNAYRTKNDPAKAIQHYEKALSIDPESTAASYNLANLYLQMNRPEQSVKYFLATIQNDPQNAMAHANLGVAYSRMGRSSEAIARFQKSIIIRPAQHLAYYGLGLEYLKLNDLEKAEANYHKVLEFKPDFERAYCDLGTIMMRRNNYGEAARYFEKALQIDPGYEQARRLLEQVERGKRSLKAVE